MTDTPRDVKLHFGISSTLTHGHTWYPRSLHETRQLGRTKLYPVTAAPPRIQSYPIERPKSSLQTAAPVSGTRLHFCCCSYCYCWRGPPTTTAPSSFLHLILPSSPDTSQPLVEAFPLTTSQIRQVLLLKQPLEMGGDPT